MTKTQVVTPKKSSGPLAFTGASSALLAVIALGALCIGVVAKRRGDAGLLHHRAIKGATAHSSADEIRRQQVDRSHW